MDWQLIGGVAFFVLFPPACSVLPVVTFFWGRSIARKRHYTHKTLRGWTFHVEGRPAVFVGYLCQLPMVALCIGVPIVFVVSGFNWLYVLTGPLFCSLIAIVCHWAKDIVAWTFGS
jgi:hypothetical protein